MTRVCGINIDPDDIIVVHCTECDAVYNVMAGEEENACEICESEIEVVE